MSVLQLGSDARQALTEGEYLEWILEAFGAGGFGSAGAALFILFIPAVGLFNWTESFKVPAVWLSLTAPLVSAFLPVPVVWRLIGLITTAVAMLFVGLWIFWQRM